jgi:hypothetical protein
MQDRPRSDVVGGLLFALPLVVAAPVALGAFALAMLLPREVDPGCLASPSGAFGDAALWSGAICAGVAGGVALLPAAFHASRGRTDPLSFLRLMGAAMAACFAPVGALVLVIDLLVVPVGRFRCWELDGDEIVLRSAIGDRRVQRDDVESVAVEDDADRGQRLVLRLRGGDEGRSVWIPRRVGTLDDARDALAAD